MTLRLASPGDAEQIRQIYNHEVSNTVATFDLVPRTLEDQKHWLAERNGAFAAIVAVDPADADRRGRRLRLAVAVQGARRLPNQRRGLRLRPPRPQRPGDRQADPDRAARVAAASGFHAVFGRIAATSEASIALHRSCGFELVGIEREAGRKFNRWLDVALMQALL